LSATQLSLIELLITTTTTTTTTITTVDVIYEYIAVYNFDSVADPHCR
jgi:hypothetical protein